MRITSVRMVLAIAVIRNLEIHQMDMKMTFLNGDLEEKKLYMNQREGLMAPGLESKKSALGTSLDEEVRGCDLTITENGKGGGYLVFLIGGGITRNSINRQRYGCQDKRRMEKQHGVNIMAVEVQIGWLWTWPERWS
ncbi:zinc finger CCCH domain-containing protein 14 [Tanacetum coccineum]